MFVAITFINLFAVFSIFNGSMFKYVHKTYGFEVVDYSFMRCISLTLFTIIYVNIMKIDVFTLPQSKTRSKWIKLMILRSVFGHACFFVFNMSFLFGNVSLIMIVFQTNPFFASIFGYFVNEELVQRFELIGMVLCFFGICILGLSSMNSQVSQFESGNEILGIIFPLITAIIFASQSVAIRYLRDLHFT